MRLHILSDLHLEGSPFEPAAVDADVVVVAGDLHPGVRSVEWAAERWPDRPVVLVPGNHEFYGHAHPRLVRLLRERAAQLGDETGAAIHVLSDAAVEIGGVRFLGATLWTDFELLGTPRDSASEARQRMTDFRSVLVEPPPFRNDRRPPAPRACLPSDMVEWHRGSLRWLAARLADDGWHDGEADAATAAARTVVVTHHAPSARSLNPRYADAAAAAYASRLDDLVAASGAALWVHGHTHHCVDYVLGRTRVVSNQRGYPAEEVAGFDPALVVAL